MRFLKAGRIGRRKFIVGLLALALPAPFVRLLRVRADDFVHKDGWILRKDDLA